MSFDQRLNPFQEVNQYFPDTPFVEQKSSRGAFHPVKSVVVNLSACDTATDLRWKRRHDGDVTIHVGSMMSRF